MSTTVFLLGAGFSRSISAEMPLMSELSQAVRARLEERGLPLPPATDAFGDDIERWLSYLAEPLPWFDEPSMLRNRAAFADVSHAIDELLTERQEVVVESTKPAWLSDLVDFWCRSRSTVITPTSCTRRLPLQLRRLG